MKLFYSTTRKIFIPVIAIFFSGFLSAQPGSRHNLLFNQLPAVWDEALPLGNGTVGALVWQKENKLRFSLDRADIWDLRPLKGLHREEFSYQWIEKKVLEKDYKPVQEYFDAPYDREPAPSKIPAGALEFSLPSTPVQSVQLSLKNALATVTWQGGEKLQTFVHATQPVGWFRFENIKHNLAIQLVAPAYEGKLSDGEINSLVGDDLARLGYQQGNIQHDANSITYTQKGWGDFTYEINVRWKKINSSAVEGVWSISSHYAGKKTTPAATRVSAQAFARGYAADYSTHLRWWNNFWSKSSLQVPDSIIEKQWYLEQYKFGAAARKGAPPVSLQAVWTADNGRIPPWKGDFHHDLNTQLSYWPSYSGNHLEEAAGYIDHLEENKANYKRYTKLFFGKEGLAIPGVTTLDGTEMGGWTQYSLSPTVSSWLAHHYYLQWRYSMDKQFLEEKAYPFIKDVCTFLEDITVKEANGLRRLPLSSSPEINNNKINAWFLQNTNYDLALMKFAFTAAIEMAEALQLREDVAGWQQTLAEFGDYAVTENDELMFAPNLPYAESHRHFSHLMAIHPLGLIKWEDGAKAQSIIKNTVALLDKVGPDYWCGYSYSWLANLKARAKDGEGAAKALNIFATAFCLPNSFHANGDQTKSGLSKFTYRPFTLEGNFAYAAGLQEMLLQSYAGFIEIFPAVPQEWKNISFSQLRAEGAYLVSAKKVNGTVTEIKIAAEKAGKTQLKLPFTHWKTAAAKGIKVSQSGDFLDLSSMAGGEIVISNAGGL
ncbi:MAG: glycoside hydrolase N-terminal domain-containing protein [Chitinophagaceae bacterium]|nr:glycoside hydrolase N-terminal domain-containing protein [Chitinophagaceae bacterium]